jgi:hypothetical protein
MLRRRREEKARKSILETLMRDMQGTGAEKLALFEKLKAAGGFVNAPAAEVAKAEMTLRAFAAMEKNERRERMRVVRPGSGMPRGHGSASVQ